MIMIIRVKLTVKNNVFVNASVPATKKYLPKPK